MTVARYRLDSIVRTNGTFFGSDGRPVASAQVALPVCRVAKLDGDGA